MVSPVTKERPYNQLRISRRIDPFGRKSRSVYNLQKAFGRSCYPGVSLRSFVLTIDFHQEEEEMSIPLQIRTIESMPFGENTYVVWLPQRTDALVIDPGLEPDLILDFLRDEGLTPAAILNTHGHGDHIGGNAALKQAYPQAPLMIGANEAKLLTDANANMSAPFGLPIISPPADSLVREGDVVEAAGIRLEVLDIPGHSPGHVVFLYRASPSVVFGGDVLFRGSIGRCDFPNSNGRLLFQGIRDKLFTLPPDTVVYPGHGPVTTVGHEKRTNPFVGEDATVQ
jgi:glyoxylase-like metal-dependent hydrolase (beta-lactamase superfamily II)